MVEAIHQFLNNCPDWLHVFTISMIPVIELRGAIPYGILLTELTVWQTYLLSVLGNLVPAPIIVYLIDGLFNLMLRSKSEFLVKTATKIKERGMKKSDKIRKYTYLGIIIFIAIPLPGTGVWTGCLIAVLLRLNPFKSVLAAAAGASIAGIIVTLLVKTGQLLVSA